jgi:hypothetical protein
MDDYDSYISKLKTSEAKVDFDKMLIKVRHKNTVVSRQRMAFATMLMIFVLGFAAYYLQMQTSVDNDMVMSYVFGSQQSSDEWNFYLF